MFVCTRCALEHPSAPILVLRERTVMHVACEKGNVAIMEVLLNSHPEAVNQKDEEGNSPLDCAIMENRLDIARYVQSMAINSPNS